MVPLFPLLIPSCDEEHGSPVRCCTSNDDEPDTDRSTVHRRLSIRPTKHRSVPSGSGVARSRAISITVSAERLVGDDREARIDHGHQLSGTVVGHGVDFRRWRMQIQLEVVHQVARDESQSQGGDVSQILRRIVRLQSVHEDLVVGYAEPVRDTLREEVEDLCDRNRV